MYRRLFGLGVLSLWFAHLSAQSLTWLGVLPGGSVSRASAVSSTGMVVGSAWNAQGQERAFLWSASVGMFDLGVLPGGTRSRALAIAADGQTVVGIAVNAEGRDRAFRWTNTTGMVELGTLGGLRSGATGVSANGTYIVGWAHTSSNATHAFRWSSLTGMQDLGTLGGVSSLAYGVSGDGTTVVGVSNLPQGFERAFRWTTTGMQNLNTLGGTKSRALAVSANGQVIVGGSYRDQTQTWNAFRWEASTGIMGLPLLNGYWGSEALAVSCDGTVIVGRAYNPGEDPTAVRWIAGIGIQNLNSVYAGLLSPGSVLYEAIGISPEGRYIVGTGYNALTNRSEAFLLDMGPTCTPHNGDVNRDGCVDDTDLLSLLFAFGQSGCGVGANDANCDGVVDDADLLIALFHFGENC